MRHPPGWGGTFLAHPAGVLVRQQAEALDLVKVGVWGLVGWDPELSGVAADASSRAHFGAAIVPIIDRSRCRLPEVPRRRRPLGVAGEEYCPE